MALTLAELQAKRDALILQISSGAQSVRLSDGVSSQEVQNASIESMLKALAFLDSEIAAAGGDVPADRFSFASMSRG